MCNQNVSVYEVHPAGRLTLWLSESVCELPYPSSHAFHEPECAGSEVLLSITAGVALHGAAVPVSNPGLPSFWPGLAHPPPPPPMVQVNDVPPEAPVLSVTVTETEKVPVVVGVPEISPVPELIDRPPGRPLAA